MNITAAVARAPSAPFSIESLVLDGPRDDEILVRISGAGLCHTDLMARDQSLPVPFPVVLGHEGAGVVERIGSKITRVQPGDHVVLTFRSCGVCKNCFSHRPAYCRNIFPLNFLCLARPDHSGTLGCNHGATPHGSFFGQSSFASYAIAYEDNVVPVARDLPLALLGPLGCGIQTGAGAILNALRPSAGDSIAVFGAGAVGLSAVMAARLSGVDPIIAIDRNLHRLALARALGATAVIDSSREDVPRTLLSLAPEGLDFNLDTTGNPKLFRQAVEGLKIGGTCGFAAGSPPGVEAVFEMQTILLGRTIRGIIEGDSLPQQFIPQMIDFYRQGRFPFDRLITTFPLDRINEAVAAVQRGEVVKAVLIP